MGAGNDEGGLQFVGERKQTNIKCRALHDYKYDDEDNKKKVERRLSNCWKRFQCNFSLEQQQRPGNQPTNNNILIVVYAMIT